jgi:hypothetical protein
MIIITYATHASGTFDTLVHNEHKAPVKVIGWGEPWKGYIRKAHCVREYIENLDDDEIVVVIDGWDVQIKRPVNTLEEDFLNFDCKVLVSLDPEKSGTYLTRRIFGTFTDDVVANAGLYMGYVKYLKIYLDAVFAENTRDDQRAMNSLGRKLPWIKVDMKNDIFSNTVDNQKCYFLHNPGNPTIERIIRSVTDYSQYIWPEYLLVALVVYFLYLHYIR